MQAIWDSIAIISLLGAVVAFAIGPGPVPWLLAPEILPDYVASTGISLCVFANWYVVGP
jgi:hypothetical protein